MEVYMADDVKKVYKFHFKVDAEMMSNINGISMFKRAGNISRLIVRVLTLLSPGLEEKHLKNEQMMSRYEFVCEDKNMARKNVFVYLPDKFYRELKLMHQDLNYYSMAQLLRLVLRVFLGFAEVYGEDVESKLMAFYLQWKAKRASRKYEWKPVKELLHFIYQKPRMSRFLTLYSNKFQPISFYRL
jgi:hypothetical protein